MGKCGPSHCAWPALAALILGLGIGNISAASVYIAAEQCLAPAPSATVPDYVMKYGRILGPLFRPIFFFFFFFFFPFLHSPGSFVRLFAAPHPVNRNNIPPAASRRSSEESNEQRLMRPGKSIVLPPTSRPTMAWPSRKSQMCSASVFWPSVP